MARMTERELSTAQELLLRDLLHHLSALEDYDERVRFGELLLTGAREILPATSWRRDQILGQPGSAPAFTWCAHRDG